MINNTNLRWKSRRQPAEGSGSFADTVVVAGGSDVVCSGPSVCEVKNAGEVVVPEGREVGEDVKLRIRLQQLDSTYALCC